MDPLDAQKPPPVALPRTELHTLHAEGIGEVQLRVALPVAGFLGGAAPEPRGVVYVLDGDLYFGTAAEMTRLLSRFMGELPPLLVVGIGYGTDDPALFGELRTRDMTPTSDPELAAMARSLPGAREPSLPEGERTGGADRFLDFLETRVRPFVEDRWPVPEGEATLFGSSLGGLLGAWGLLTRPGLFDRWVLASPSLWWHDGVTLEREREGARAGERLQGRVYLAAGSLEEGIPALDAYRLVGNTRTFAERLQGRDDPELEVSFEVIEGESHTSVVPAALLRGLRALHPRQRPPGGP